MGTIIHKGVNYGGGGLSPETEEKINEIDEKVDELNDQLSGWFSDSATDEEDFIRKFVRWAINKYGEDEFDTKFITGDWQGKAYANCTICKRGIVYLGQVYIPQAQKAYQYDTHDGGASIEISPFSSKGKFTTYVFVNGYANSQHTAVFRLEKGKHTFSKAKVDGYENISAMTAKYPQIKIDTVIVGQRPSVGTIFDIKDKEFRVDLVTTASNWTSTGVYLTFE